MIETDRLIIRDWRDSDRAPFAAMCRDPAVMATIGPLINRAEADALIDRQRALQARLGYTFWALESRDTGEYLGFCGLKPMPERIAGLEGVLEIGWRLREQAWGKGYAREAATACIAWAWANLADDRIAAITTPGNARSWGLMLRLGMVRRHDLDFRHPALAQEDPLSQHITHEIWRPGVLPR